MKRRSGPGNPSSANLPLSGESMRHCEYYAKLNSRLKSGGCIVGFWVFHLKTLKFETENYIYIGGNTGTIWGRMLANIAA